MICSKNSSSKMIFSSWQAFKKNPPSPKNQFLPFALDVASVEAVVDRVVFKTIGNHRWLTPTEAQKEAGESEQKRNVSSNGHLASTRRLKQKRGNIYHKKPLWNNISLSSDLLCESWKMNDRLVFKLLWINNK